ncbi:MAG: hypothetical protein ACRC17_11650 [Culicoidibacterales bacterium]
MNKNLSSKFILATLSVALGTSVVAPTLLVSADVIKSNNVISKANQTIAVDGVTYSIKEIAESIRSDIDYTEDYSSVAANERSVVTKGIKMAYKWLRSNWSKVYNKLPSWAKKYFVFDQFFRFADQWIGISSSIEDFLNRTFRSMGMPENVNWAITNVIMLLLPI